MVMIITIIIMYKDATIFYEYRMITYNIIIHIKDIGIMLLRFGPFHY